MKEIPSLMKAFDNRSGISSVDALTGKPWEFWPLMSTRPLRAARSATALVCLSSCREAFGADL